MNCSYLHKYPYIRLSVLWMAGVFCGDRFFGEGTEPDVCAFLFCLLAVLAAGCHFFLRRHSLRWCFGACVSLLCFVGGWGTVTWQLAETAYRFPERETAYRIRLTDAPEEKERSVLCRAVIEECRDSLVARAVGRKALLYFAKDSSVSALREGNELWISSRIALPKHGKNFCEFDYGRYLLHQGVSGTGYVATGHWRLLPTVAPPSLRQVSDAYRDKVIALYRRLGFEGERLAVLSALTVGDKTELSESIRESYSVSGASHVLALSGLHIGLLYALLAFLFGWMARRGRAGKWGRAVIVLSLLWAFAFFTGMSPSVVRAVCMCSVVAMAVMTGRQAISLNTVAGVAWGMLLFRPTWLFDVGFQLSFLAVAAILIVQSRLYQLVSVKSRWGKWVWGLLTVSVAAQMGTAPLVMYYFSAFPTHFLLTNLIVVPAVTLILYVAVFMLLLTPFAGLQAMAAEVCDGLLGFLNAFVRWVERLPFASIDNVWLYRWEVTGIYLLFLLLLYYIRRKHVCRLVLCLCCLLALTVGHAVAKYADRPRRSIVFYNVRNCPAVHCIDSDGRSWLHYADSLPDESYLRRIASNYWRKTRLHTPQEVNADGGNRVFAYYGCRIGMIADDRWRNKSAAFPLPVRYLYICKGYKGSITELSQVFLPSCVVLDASLPECRKHALAQECARRRISLVSLSEEGSVRLLL